MPLAKAVNALFVGINDYQAVTPLRGCVNDVERVLSILEARVDKSNTAFNPMLLTNEEATRDAILDAFRNHLGRSASGDVALFYFCGHGSQQKSPPEFWHLEPDRLDETIIPVDSRTEGVWDISDKELAQLIYELSENNPHIVVILDCCHSGSGTRDPEGNVSVRRAPLDNRIRPIDSYILNPEENSIWQNSSNQRSAEQKTEWFRLPVGNHILLSSCRSEELAKELNLGGEQRGVFSYFLGETLQQTGEGITYRDVFKRVNAMVRNRVSQQSPQIEATEVGDIDRPFLGGAIAKRRPYFTLHHDTKQGWKIDGGSVHGIPPAEGREATFVSLFEIEADQDGDQASDMPIGTAKVTTVSASSSQVEIIPAEIFEFDLESTYRAEVVSTPLEALKIHLSGSEVALEILRDALGASGENLVQESSEEEAELQVIAEDEKFIIRRISDAYPLIVETEGWNMQSAQLVIQRLQHMTRWKRCVQLTNKNSGITAHAVQIEILMKGADDQWHELEQDSDLYLEYQLIDGKWVPPVIKIKIRNMTNHQRLYCMLFDLPETYGNFPLLARGGTWLNPEEEAWANEGQAIHAMILDRFWEQGLTKLKSTLKLIVSTDEVDASLIAQEDLPVSFAPRRSSREFSPSTQLNSLNRLLGRINSRHFSSEPQPTEPYSDWTTQEISVTIVRPLDASAVPSSPTESVDLGFGVSIQGHPQLKANAKLTSLSEASRDLGSRAFAPALRFQTELQPFEFSTARGGEPGLSVLELSQPAREIGIQNFESVSPESPIILNTDIAMKEDERLLAVAYDGEFYLPVGRCLPKDRGTEICIDHLPEPLSEGARSIMGSIRILFYKMISEKLSLNFAYPILAAANVDGEGEVSYEGSMRAVKEKVTESDRILLYIHGILGDTRRLAASSEPSWMEFEAPPPSLADRYDLILTFDYENINTSIQSTAILLKERLDDVGLGQGHGKTLDVIAHSMGGLVARCFIEQESGHQVISHLVLVGTPNAGSPWPALQDWATAALAFWLNGLAVFAWPTHIIGSLIGAIEMIDVTLDQMKPNSEFLSMLEKSGDPNVPYSIIAGNTSLREGPVESETDGESRIQKLLKTLIKGKNVGLVASDIAFLGQPNDLAVSVESISKVPLSRDPASTLIEVPCDHMTYFTTEESLRAISEQLK